MYLVMYFYVLSNHFILRYVEIKRRWRREVVGGKGEKTAGRAALKMTHALFLRKYPLTYMYKFNHHHVSLFFSTTILRGQQKNWRKKNKNEQNKLWSQQNVKSRNTCYYSGQERFYRSLFSIVAVKRVFLMINEL